MICRSRSSFVLLTLWFVIVEGGGELDVGVVAGCDSMQVGGALVDGGGTTELKTCRSSLGARVTSMMSATTWFLVLDVMGFCSENET